MWVIWQIWHPMAKFFLLPKIVFRHKKSKSLCSFSGAFKVVHLIVWQNTRNLGTILRLTQGLIIFFCKKKDQIIISKQLFCVFQKTVNICFSLDKVRVCFHFLCMCYILYDFYAIFFWFWTKLHPNVMVWKFCCFSLLT